MDSVLSSILATGSTIPVQVAAATSVAIIAGVSYVTNKRSRAEFVEPARHAKKAKKAKKANKSSKKPAKTLVHALQSYAASVDGMSSDLYTFLDDRGTVIDSLSPNLLHRKAQAVAQTLAEHGTIKGDRVILCFPPGLDFAVAFWACLYAGAIAIPIYPPYPGTLAKDLPHFSKIVADSGAHVVLTNRTYSLSTKLASVKNIFSQAAVSWPSDLTWLCVDSIPVSKGVGFVGPPLRPSDVAFFQYSSGSTSAPKAVIISHANILAQMQTWSSITSSDVLISWLPSYHDMGLVGFILVPVYTKSQCVSMSPISFIKKPELWLTVASRFRGTHLCSPNFGYALVARKVSKETLMTLDLSCVKQAICAAEPIRADTLSLFTRTFSSVGFDDATFNCGYGLAEVTLVCTGQNPRAARKAPTILYVNKQQLENKKLATDIVLTDDNSENVITLVGCGVAAPTFNVIVVQTLDTDNTDVVAYPDKRPENHIGEIWVSGPSVAVGYFGKKDFYKTLDGHQYFPTGDLGFLRHQELFITGRLKDLIIIRGRNICPQDVEVSVETAHAAIRPGCVAAFSVDNISQSGNTTATMEGLVVVAEFRTVSTDAAKLDQAVLSIQNAVLRDHQVSPYAIVLLHPRTIPKTTSGKIQRHKAKLGFLAHSLKALKVVIPQRGTTTVVDVPHVDKVDVVPASKNLTTSTSEIDITSVMTWLLTKIDTQDPHTPWAALGMDSVALVSLSAELGDFIGQIVPPAAFFQHVTPHALAHAPGLLDGTMKIVDTSSGGDVGTEDNGGVEKQNRIVDENDPIPESFYRISEFPEVTSLVGQMDQLNSAGLEIPYLNVLTATSRQMINFNTYNYLGLAGHPEVSDASKTAIDEYGTSMSSSPIVGQTQINQQLETDLAGFFQAQAAILFVGGWVANVTTIDALVGKKDLILCDALNHNSCVVGQRLSGATTFPFPHNDVRQADKILTRIRHQYRRVLIVIEGCYSMDGDMPDLAQFVELKKKHKALLFLDEAHSFGTLGETGRGLTEYAGVDPAEVDIRMGTMSKALGSTGGFILGSHSLIQYLKYCAGGFVFSVGLTPCNAASALTALTVMQREPQRVLELQQKSAYFLKLAQDKHLQVGTVVTGSPVVVVYVGSTVDCVQASMQLAQQFGVDVKPIVYPAVEEGKCRLRFFLSSLRTKQEIQHTVNSLVKILIPDRR